MLRPELTVALVEEGGSGGEMIPNPKGPAGLAVFGLVREMGKDLGINAAFDL
jgi:hypothetical protein